jgi:hypothetical protein
MILGILLVITGMIGTLFVVADPSQHPTPRVFVPEAVTSQVVR